MAHDVFISYSTQDKLTADAVCAVLEAKGIRCWIAPRDIAFGADWTESIVNALESCRIMVLIFSQHANDSTQIKREVNLAVDNGVTVIPVRVEDIMPSKSLKFSIAITHWLDAFPPPLENHLDRLAKAIRGNLGASAMPEEGSRIPGGESGAPAEIQAQQPPAPATLQPPTLPSQQPPPLSSPPPLRRPPPVYQQPQGQPPYAQTAPSQRKRNVGLLILMGFLWMLAFYFGGLFVLGAIAGMTHPSNAEAAGNEVGQVMAFPLFLIASGVSIWLTIVGKLPGTRIKAG